MNPSRCCRVRPTSEELRGRCPGSFIHDVDCRRSRHPPSPVLRPVSGSGSRRLRNPPSTSFHTPGNSAAPSTRRLSSTPSPRHSARPTACPRVSVNRTDRSFSGSAPTTSPPYRSTTSVRCQIPKQQPANTLRTGGPSIPQRTPASPPGPAPRRRPRNRRTHRAPHRPGRVRPRSARTPCRGAILGCRAR